MHGLLVLSFWFVSKTIGLVDKLVCVVWMQGVQYGEEEFPIQLWLKLLEPAFGSIGSQAIIRFEHFKNHGVLKLPESSRV